MNMVLAHLIRSEGASREASFGMSFGGLLNMLLDPFFIYDWGLGLKMEGAAIAPVSPISRLPRICCIISSAHGGRM